MSTSAAIIKACSGELGARLAEIRAAVGPSTYVNVRVGELVKRGDLHAGGDYHFRRYFADPAHLAAWLPMLDQERKDRAEAALEARRKTWREFARAKRTNAPKQERKPRSTLSLEERKARKAEGAKRRYREKRAKLGLTVKPRATRPEDIPTTPRKAANGESGRGRGIVIQPSKFKPPHAIKQKHSSEPIITSHTKVTICPSYEDRRFKPDPSIAGRGAITEMWMDERLKRAGGFAK